MRDYRIDNAKGVLIAFVVLGHFLIVAGGWDDPVLSALLLFVQPFHMPAFVFLVGATTNGKNLSRRITTVVVLLVVFQVAYAVPLMLVTGNYPNGPLQPYFHLWFMLSMLWWTAAIPLVHRVPAPLTLSIVIALGAGLIPWTGYDFSSSRTLVHLPFFVAGHLYGRGLLDRIRALESVGERYLPVRPLLLLALTGIAAFNYVHHVPYLLFYGSANYHDMGFGPLTGIAARGYQLALAAFSTAAIISIAGDRPTWLAKVGAASLSVYLLHMFVTDILIRFKILHPIFLHHFGSAVMFLVALLAAAVTVAVFSIPAFDRAIRRLPDVFRLRNSPMLGGVR